LKQPAIAQKIRRAYVQDGMPKEKDPDAALYGAFLQEEDKARSNHLYQEIAQGRWPDMDFRDGRLPALAARMKARSFPQMMTQDECAAWQDYVKGKLVGEGDWLNLVGFAQRLSELEAEDLPAGKREILKELGAYGVALKAKYELV
jgi:exodeoxyribonuclease-1